MQKSVAVAVLALKSDTLITLIFCLTLTSEIYPALKSRPYVCLRSNLWKGNASFHSLIQMSMLLNFVTGQYWTLVCKDRPSYNKGIKVKKKNKNPWRSPVSSFYIAGCWMCCCWQPTLRLPFPGVWDVVQLLLRNTWTATGSNYREEMCDNFLCRIFIRRL